MRKLAGLILCAGLLIGSAVLHGSATHRWSLLSPDPAIAKAVHEQVVQLADYKSNDIPSELPVKERSIVTCRQYLSPTGLPPFVVSVTSGPPGAVSTHTPDVCYPGSGYRTVAEPRQETIDLPNGGKATYIVADYEKKSATSYERQRIRWCWSTGGTWVVPERPRFAFLNQPELYKIYVVTAIGQDMADQVVEDSPAVKTAVAAAFEQMTPGMSQPK